MILVMCKLLGATFETMYYVRREATDENHTSSIIIMIFVIKACKMNSVKINGKGEKRSLKWIINKNCTKPFSNSENYSEFIQYYLKHKRENTISSTVSISFQKQIKPYLISVNHVSLEESVLSKVNLLVWEIPRSKAQTHSFFFLVPLVISFSWKKSWYKIM